MAAPTLCEDVLVLKKTKLGESDLILSFLAEDGRQLRAVAKGARKPTSSFSSRLELFSHARVLLVKGRSLDIVKEAKLQASHDAIRGDLLRSTGAAVLSELVVKSTEIGLDNQRLFLMLNAYLDQLETIPEAKVSLLTLACLVKVVALLGFRPCLDSCAECGMPRDDHEPVVALSVDMGGILCPDCSAAVPFVKGSLACVSWLDALVLQRFADIGGLTIDSVTLRECLAFCGAWVETQMSIHLKSMGMFLSLLES